ncbi:cell wall protein TIR4-like [Zingiber officinale]|uniref:cell wall protein TIR4-like n=1 Tax=Zingiber officinale TaxID=94328 RepID=UPI001C4C8265|nr:cell wall protein TIR4-like [Zingiber officinale]
MAAERSSVSVWFEPMTALVLPVEASSSQVAPDVLEILPARVPAITLPTVSSSVAIASSSATSLSVAELTSPINSEKSLVELAPEKSKKQYETQLESLQSQFKSATNLNTELSSKLEKQLAETNKLRSDYESTLADKLKSLQLKDEEITSLNTSLNTAKMEASTKDAELKSSRTTLVEYKAGEDNRFKDRAMTLISSTEFNRPIIKSILAAYTTGAEGATRLQEEGFQSRDPPPNFLNHRKLIDNRPANLFSQLSIE